MGPNERASIAIAAMKSYGITEKRVKPVLKNLLRLYDKNWELIEDENYRVLIDAIFEQENEVEEEEPKKNKEAEVHDELPEPSLKRTRLRSQADQAPPTDEIPLKRLKEEDGLPVAHRRSGKQVIISSQELNEDEQEMPASSLALSIMESEEPSQLYTRDRVEHDPRSKGKEPVSSSLIPRRKDILHDHPQLKENLLESNSISTQKQLRVNETEPTSAQMTSRDKGARPTRSSLGVCFKEPKVEPGIRILPREKSPDSRGHVSLINPKSEPTDDPTDDYLPFEVPIAIMPPPYRGQTIDDVPLREDGCSTVNGSTGKANGSTRQVNGVEYLASKSNNVGVLDRACIAATSSESANVPEAPKTVTSTELVNVSETPTSFEIASSPLGEVKISLNCNQVFERPDFRIPSLDAVLKAVEDKCLRSYRILEPNFSMMKLMQEMCQSFLDLSNRSTDPQEDNMIHIATDFDFLKKSNLRNAFGVNGSRLDNGGTFVNLSDDESGAERKDPNHTESRSLVVIPQQQGSLDDVRPPHDVNDISKGEERVRISLINEASSESYPPRFYYIPRNIVYQNAYVNFSLARIGDEDCCSNCFGDCLSSSIPCACARETGGEFAYTLEGLVKEKLLDEFISMNRDPQQHNHFYCKQCPLERSKEGLTEPCKGHLVRKFIKECWSKCGCNMQCGNRVVQRGITCNLQVFLTSEGKGWGLRTLEELPKGTFICEYVGEILTNTELYDRNMRSSGKEKHTYPVLLDADWGSEGVLKDEEALCLDATYYGNVARFINHRCFDATLVEIPVEVETPDHHYYHLAFFTTRKVDALEELTWDYGIDFNDHNHPVKAFRCQCGSKCCRDMKRSHRSKSRR